jgi:hypothetical protein
MRDEHQNQLICEIAGNVDPTCLKRFEPRPTDQTASEWKRTVIRGFHLESLFEPSPHQVCENISLDISCLVGKVFDSVKSVVTYRNTLSPAKTASPKATVHAI